MCTLVDSTTWVSGTNLSPHFCIDSSKTINIYTLFPGQKVFISVYHPVKTLEPKTINTGSIEKFYKVDILTTVDEKLPEKANCKELDDELLTIVKAHEDYENWLVIVRHTTGCSLLIPAIPLEIYDL